MYLCSMDVGKVLVLEMLFLLEIKLLPARNIFFLRKELGTEDYRIRDGE